MSNTVTIQNNAVFFSKLSIERCQVHLAHLHALVHFCGVDEDKEALIGDNFRRIIEVLESELMHSAHLLSHCD